MAVDPERLTVESRQALVEEAARRGLRMPPAWAGVALLVASYQPPGSAGARHYTKAPFGSRLLAYIIDVFVAAAGPIGAAVVVALSSLFNTNAPLAIGIIALSVLWPIYYSFTKDGREGGQSIGKEMLNLMVVNTTTNQPCSTGESAMRALILFAVNLVPLVGWLIEPIMALSDEDGRRLGDRAAGTQVIATSEYIPSIR